MFVSIALSKIELIIYVIIEECREIGKRAKTQNEHFFLQELIYLSKYKTTSV